MMNLTSVADIQTAVSENEFVLVDFWATWCGPCKMISKTLEEIADEYPELTIVKVEADKAEEASDEYGIRNIPSLLFFVRGEMKAKIAGAVGKPALVAKLDELSKAIG